METGKIQIFGPKLGLRRRQNFSCLTYYQMLLFSGDIYKNYIYYMNRGNFVKMITTQDISG